MDPMGVIPLFALSGVGFACFGDIWPLGPPKSVGFIVFWKWLVMVVLVMVVFTIFLVVLMRLVFGGILLFLLGLGLAGPIQHFRSAILDAWRNEVAADLCGRKGFRGGPLFDIHGSLQLLNSFHVRAREVSWLGTSGMVFCWVVFVVTSLSLLRC